MVVVSGGQLHFHKWGAGERLLIAIHGFEGDGAWFAPLGALLPSNTCLYAPDLPWHGRTQWHKASFSTSDFVEMVDALRTHAGIADYTAIGFSLGARLWMGSLSALAPGRMRKLVLLAPDGLASRWDKGFSLLYAAVGAIPAGALAPAAQAPVPARCPLAVLGSFARLRTPLSGTQPRIPGQGPSLAEHLGPGRPVRVGLSPLGRGSANPTGSGSRWVERPPPPYKKDTARVRKGGYPLLGIRPGRACAALTAYPVGWPTVGIKAKFFM